MLGINTNINRMKNYYTTVLQVLQILLVCLLSTTAGFASNSPNTTSPTV